ncbi:hypothetical protein KIPB_010960 [Kipferlia bialata]|uniref:Tc1-like transposase DDE domain-containing protein n=1 Tax=Kipferlia bialata TaxID=797122 RepID=A0A391NYY7_9EUKA|nr:hypothetical protein KIPB_010960 [Kipferlia bialata]|eukprot:g10960.t1
MNALRVTLDRLVFLDETSKDMRDAIRKYGWGPKNIALVVMGFFGRGDRVSVLAFQRVTGIKAIYGTPGTFRSDDFTRHVLDYLDRTPPPPNSCLVMDGASIHHQQELCDGIKARGHNYVFLPAYCPNANPVEFVFQDLKHELQYGGDIHTTSVLGYTKTFNIVKSAFLRYQYHDYSALFSKCGFHLDGSYSVPHDVMKADIQ